MELRSKWLIALLLSSPLVLAHDAGAVSTRSWTTATYKDFDEGEADSAIITSLGEVLPGRATERVDLEADAVWTAVRAADGTVYAGGVTDGTIWAVSGGKKKVLATLDKDTPWIGALLLGPDGTLYAGTVGTGAIWTVDPKTGKAHKLVALEGVDHVWSLALDGAGKTLYAGTGPAAKLFAVDLGSKAAKAVLDLEDKQIMAMTLASDGALWLGTSDQAILYRFDPKAGQARAIADFAGTEVKGIVEVDGAFVVASNEFDKAAAASSGAKGPAGTAAKPPEAGAAPGSQRPKGADTAVPARPGEKKGKGGLFRVEPDGRTEQLHALAEGYFTALAASTTGDVWAAAGQNGRVYQLRPDRTVVTAFDVDERQVNAVMAGKDGLLAFATGDGAAVYTVGGAAKDATYTSKVFDALFPARWGNLRWRGEDGLVIETRSGNTAKPDRGWSGWQKPAAASRGGGGATLGRVTSPPGRYLQYRATFAAAPQGALREVTTYYLPQNQRARVTEVTLGDGTDPAKRPPVTTAGGAAKPRSPVVKLKWKVENPDEDELAYTLEVRAEGDVEWAKVPSGEGPLVKAELEWNTEALPDGYYRLRITATDTRVNPRDLALDHAYLSPPFLVDNQKPRVEGVTVKNGFASGRAVDSFSRIDEIAYSVDGGDWVVAFPKDGLFDDLAELFTLKLPADLEPGNHVLSIRVADEADNIGAATTTFRVGR